MSGDLKEYSVIYTDRAKNLMSASFSQASKDIARELCEVYEANDCVIIPGSGTYGMEAVIGQFARFKSEKDYAPCLVVRNGYFSFRWSEIWDWVFPPECGRSPEIVVLKATQQATSVANHPSIAPFPLEAAVAEIRAKKPCVVFAPHVETSAGIILSPEYISALAKATHESREDAIFVLDCIASGNIWTPMRQLGVDVIVTAPQKGWTSPSCAAVVMLSEHARAVMDKQNAVSQAAVGRPRGHSFACNLAKWTSVADAYKPDGGFMYHTTLPTDALMTFRDVILETKAYGYGKLQANAQQLGHGIRAALHAKGFESVAAEGWKSPTVVVCYMRSPKDADMLAKFKAQGLQLAAGVPLKIDEPWMSADGGIAAGKPPTFRVGLFGLDKLKDVPLAIKTFEDALDAACKL